MNTPDTPKDSSATDAAAIKNAIELALLTAGQPLDLRALKRMLDADISTAQLKQTMEDLRREWSARALQLVDTAGGYQFISRAEYLPHIRRLNPERPPRLSRPLLEVLSIIAYRQPVTRGDIEQIRGVAVSSTQIAFLEEQGWIEEVGRRETPGRPVLYATTGIFLDDLALTSLNDLPPLPAEEEDNLDDTPESPATNGAPDSVETRNLRVSKDDDNNNGTPNDQPR